MKVVDDVKLFDHICQHGIDFRVHTPGLLVLSACDLLSITKKSMNHSRKHQLSRIVVPQRHERSSHSQQNAPAHHLPYFPDGRSPTQHKECFLVESSMLRHTDGASIQ